MERYVILEGTGRVEIGDLPPQEVGPGDVVIIPPDCRQRIANVGEKDLVFLCVCTPRFTSQCYENLEEVQLALINKET
jgi:mannose-6-phosphate isomerase-like protein (cupin superfamily)